MANLLRDTQREGRKGHMKREAKIGVRLPHPKTLGANRGWKRQKRILA